MRSKKIKEIELEKNMYPNKNFYKDNEYELKKDLEFDEKNEINCQKLFFFRGIPIFAIYNIYKFIYILLSFFKYEQYSYYNFFRIPIVLLCILLFILFKDVKIIINNTLSLRIFIFCIHLFDVHLFCKSLSEDGSGINYFFSLPFFINSYLLLIFMNFIFLLGYNKSLIYLALNNLNLLLAYGYKDFNIFKRLFLNIFSERLIISTIYLLIVLYIQKFLNRPTKRLWAMFDSFKKSYLSIKNIFSTISLPVMIVKDDLSEILYQNPSALHFCRKYRRIAQKGEYTFKDIFSLDTPENLQFFKKMMNNSIESKENYFMFPFIYDENEKKKHKDISYLINIDPNCLQENSCFIRFYCFPCKWKENISCYYFLINENLFTFHGGQVILHHFMGIKEELEKIMWNINTLCLNVDKKINYNITKENLFFFYIRLSINFIYDLTQTNYIYNTFIEEKKLNELSKFNFEQLIIYMSDYLSVFALNKNFSIDVRVDKKEDVICNLSYVRIIIFNILLFIIENSNDSKPKTITIKREHVKYEYNKGNYDRLIFSFHDSRPILSYETLKFFFQFFNYNFFLRRNPIEIYNLINFGLILPCLISETQYNMKDNKIKQFKIDTKGYDVNISIILFFQEVNEEQASNIEEKKFQIYENNDVMNEIKVILAKRFFRKKENIQQESLLDDGKDDNLIKANEEYKLSDDKNLVNELRAKKYVIGEHHFEDIIPLSKKNVLNMKVKFKNTQNIKKMRVEPLLNSISFASSEFKKCGIKRYLVIEEKSYEDNSLFNFILKLNNECNIDIANDESIALHKYTVNPKFDVNTFDKVIEKTNKDLAEVLFL